MEYSVDIVGYNGNQSTISENGYKFQSGMNVYSFNGAATVKTNSPITAIITSINWVKLSDLIPPNVVVKDLESGQTVNVDLSIGDFPFPHANGTFTVLIPNIAPGDIGTKRLEFDMQAMKGFIIFVSRNGNGYCHNKIEICIPNTTTCFDLCENVAYNNGLWAHGLSMNMLPFEDRLVLEFWSRNETTKNVSTSCGFNLNEFFVFGTANT